MAWAGKYWRLRSRIRFLLLLVLLAALGPVLLVQAVIYSRWLHSQQDKQIQRNLEVARSVAILFDAYVHDLERQEMALGKALASETVHADGHVHDYLASSAAEYPSVKSFGWVTPQGQIVASSDPRAVGLQIGEREYFRRVLSGPQPWVVSDLIESKMDGTAVFVVARCIRNVAGEPLGVVVAVVDAERTESILKAERFESGSIVLLDRQNYLVCYSPHMVLSWQQRQHRSDHLPELSPANPEITAIEVSPLTGEKIAIARVWIGDLGWAVGTGRPFREVMAPVWRDLWTTGVVVLLATAGSVLLAVIISRRINRAIHGLRDHALALGHDLEHRLPACGITELQEVTEALNHSASRRKQAEGQLKALNETLEHRVAERTAVAEDRARQLQVLASQLTQAEERERQRVARILHEHFQQLLVGAKFNIATMHSQLCGSDACKAPPVLEQINRVLDQAIADSRSLSIELSPPILYVSGLTDALHWLGRWMQEKHGLHVDVQADAVAEPKAESTRILLFHAVRELLFNVVKHARTSRATVRMGICNGCVELVVADDGVGLDADALWVKFDSTSGFGLFGLRERLELRGGRLRVDSRPGAGTRVTLQLPKCGPPADGESA